ncbi:hypothetical protein BUBS_277 [Bacillus phage Bubs]|uniref:hypothetical protein n=1 Tax=Bacillus phage Nemo TaxID=1805950 RepID=UPI0007A77449|nr:hypothetical protein BI006_gp276 [Bacillus phage Nemo]AMW63792.1 hypothetical protein NEMO_276 [Bacillus phage Nemo]ASR78546.1 hypothetical protein BUBS_277 [Bacillus phage Bubs]
MFNVNDFQFVVISNDTQAVFGLDVGEQKEGAILMYDLNVYLLAGLENGEYVDRFNYSNRDEDEARAAYMVWFAWSNSLREELELKGFSMASNKVTTKVQCLIEEAQEELNK